jgi:hypothetical protein
LTISVGGGPGSYAAGQRYAFVVAANNTGAATLAVNGLGAKSIRRPDGSTLAAGDLVAGNLVAVTYDGTNFRLAWSWTPPPSTAFTTDVSVSKADPALILNKTSSGQVARVFGRTDGSNRWAIELGDTTAEGGGNAGSNLVIRRYDNSGAALGTPVVINRASGAVTLEAPLTLPASNPTDANHAARKAYVDELVAAAGIWGKIVDVAVTNSTVIDVTGFSLANYQMVVVYLTGARIPTNNSSITAQIYRDGSLVTSNYSAVSEAAAAESLAVSTGTGASVSIAVAIVTNEPVGGMVAITQGGSSERPQLQIQSIHTRTNGLTAFRAGCVVSSGSGWVTGVRVTSSSAFQNNVGRIIVLGLKP